MKATIAAAGLVLVASWVNATFGQSAAAPQTFDVASVKPSQIAKQGGPGHNVERVRALPGGVDMRNVSLRSCIQWAYSVKDYQVSGPDWIAEERYDIAAKTDSPVPDAQMRLMLQALLVNRFELRLHHETKDLPLFDLVVGRSAPNPRKAASEGASEIVVRPQCADEPPFRDL
jgi:uncharacterized protein (TIGR03435 family)